jgi:hypothetical protein
MPYPYLHGGTAVQFHRRNARGRFSFGFKNNYSGAVFVLDPVIVKKYQNIAEATEKMIIKMLAPFFWSDSSPAKSFPMANVLVFRTRRMTHLESLYNLL